VSAPIDAVLDGRIEREDDLSLFFWLFGELERFEAQREADPDTRPDAVERRRRGLRHAPAAMAARPDRDRSRL
jgi:hypothetical protein